MNSPKRIVGVLTLAGLLLGCGVARANDIYIAQSATGSDNGSSCANAFPYTFFNASGNWGGGANQIGPGTTVHVCGTLTGGTNATLLNFQGSGTAGNPVTVRFESGAGLSAPYCGSAAGGAGCITMSNLSNPRSYIVVDGGTPCGWNVATNSSEGACNGFIQNTAQGTGMTYNNFSTGIEAQGCSHCEIKNVEIRNLYVNIPGDTTANAQQQNCVYFSGSNNLVHDSKMHDAGWCLANSWENGDTNNQVYNNDVSAVAHAAFNSAGGPRYATNFYYYGNYFHDYQSWNSGGFHTDGVHTFGNLGSGVYPLLTGLYIYNNIFGGNSGDSLTGQIYFSGNTGLVGNDGAVHNAWLFNNVFEVSQATDNGIVDFGAGSGHLFYNNTVVNTNATAGGSCLNWSNISQAGFTFTLENNAIQGCTSLIINNTSEVDPGITADYNGYAKCTGGNCWAAFLSGGTGSWTQYLTNPYRQDQHSVAQLPITTSTFSLNPSFAPTTGSILIGAGANLSSLCTTNGGSLPAALCSDITGKPRPTSGSWDIGAYQNTGATSPLPPTGLTSLVR